MDHGISSISWPTFIDYSVAHNEPDVDIVSMSNTLHSGLSSWWSSGVVLVSCVGFVQNERGSTMEPPTAMHDGVLTAAQWGFGICPSYECHSQTNFERDLPKPMQRNIQTEVCWSCYSSLARCGLALSSCCWWWACDFFVSLVRDQVRMVGKIFNKIKFCLSLSLSQMALIRTCQKLLLSSVIWAKPTLQGVCGCFLQLVWALNSYTLVRPEPILSRSRRIACCIIEQNLTCNQLVSLQVYSMRRLVTKWPNRIISNLWGTFSFGSVD